MGREVKRVPIDFGWPLNKPWEGYLNPFSSKHHGCESCSGSGLSPKAKYMQAQWYGNAPFKPEFRGSPPFRPEDDAVVKFAESNVLKAPGYYGYDDNAAQREAVRLADIFNTQWNHHLNRDDVTALIDEGRLFDFTHNWTKETGWQPKNPPYVPTPEEVNIWSISGMGHDSINEWIVIRAECKRLGIDYTCSVCNGEGEIWDNPDDKQASDDWERSEPPEGEGYQIWETVSEGSPISPAFLTPEELAQHMTRTRWGADVKGSSYETWLKFINGPGWAPSGIIDARGVHTGVDASR